MIKDIRGHEVDVGDYIIFCIKNTLEYGFIDSIKVDRWTNYEGSLRTNTCIIVKSTFNGNKLKRVQSHNICKVPL